MTRNRLGTIILAATLCVCWSVSAVSTKHFSLDSAEVLAEGKLEGTSVKSDGTIVPSVEIRKLDLKDVSVARSLLTTADGTSYVGTGSEGKIYKVTGKNVSLFTETKQVLVTSLAMDGGGTLYAGTLPEGKIFAIDAKGKADEFSAPENAEHIWALAYDAKKRTLFAATGPEGKIFAIDAKGKASVYLDTEADHVMALSVFATRRRGARRMSAEA